MTSSNDEYASTAVDHDHIEPDITRIDDRGVTWDLASRTETASSLLPYLIPTRTYHFLLFLIDTYTRYFGLPDGSFLACQARGILSGLAHLGRGGLEFRNDRARTRELVLLPKVLEADT